ncbi:two-component hybrid sensor and regulator [Methylophaga frappieri]|uniref:histidine kinase n=1 Tax=Methylophaga frappieri (strain ATCC BAA-2434 / DSM 25690 / JAM7) TaxID=754477 RepID=I1YEA9_METFJ|nr:HAMP domain-containing sensor histidine kinase [Methylophaga frappieri]AFJ01252.1 two-component hybrid sensor and regulator [Methylophaga frappieri]
MNPRSSAASSISLVEESFSEKFSAILTDDNHNSSGFLDLLPDAVAYFNKDGVITVTNQLFDQFVAAYNFQAPRPFTRHIFEKFLNEIALAGSQLNIDRTPPDNNISEPLKCIVLLANPQPMVIEKTVQYAHNDNIAGLIHLRDITRSYHLEKTKTQFLCTTAHELRAPLAVIYGYAELMANYQFEPDDEQNMVSVVYQETARMLKILNDLLDLAKIEAQHPSELELEKHLLSDLINNVLEVQSLALENHVISVDAQEELAIYCDKTKIQQLLINLLTNAAKYSEAGSNIAIQVSTERRQEQSGIRLEIADQGIGISPENLTRIFDHFFRADASRSVSGSGLGMSIVKEIVKLHKGTIDIHSQINQGTQVIVWLPAGTP